MVFEEAVKDSLVSRHRFRLLGADGREIEIRKIKSVTTSEGTFAIQRGVGPRICDSDASPLAGRCCCLKGDPEKQTMVIESLSPCDGRLRCVWFNKQGVMQSATLSPEVLLVATEDT